MNKRSVLFVFACALLIGPPLGLAEPSDPYERDPSETPTAQKEARGWERKPKPSSVAVVTPVVSAFGASARFLVNVVVAPLRGAALLEDRYEVYSNVQRVFYNEDRTVGVLPALAFVSDIGFSSGASAFYKDFFGNDELIRLKGLYGSRDFYSTDLKFEMPNRWNHVYLKTRGRFESDPRRGFTGIGNLGSGVLEPNGRTRFKERRFLLLAQGGGLFGRKNQVRIGGTFIYNHREFSEDSAAGAPSIGEVYQTADIPGFSGGIEVFEATADIALDLRDSGGVSGEGALFSAFGGGVIGGDWEYAHYGGEMTYYWTPLLQERVFIFRLAHEGVSGGKIPFTELPRLGGAGTLRGFRTDRFRDELSAIGTVEYHYPIHQFVSGSLFAETGKVARSYDELLGGGYRDNIHLGYGGGLTIHTEENLVVNLHLGYGHGQSGDGLQFVLATDVLSAFRSRGRRL